IEMTSRGAVLAVAVSLAADLVVFGVVVASLLGSAALAAFVRRRAEAEYWLAVGLLGVATTLICYFLICAALAFTGRAGWVTATALAAAFAATWADVARLRAQTGATGESIESLALLTSPLCGVRSRVAAIVAIVALPLVAYLLVNAVIRLDWDFLL